MSLSGHEPPVAVTFQFLLVGRLVIELSGRYSASKLTTALAQPGHNPPPACWFRDESTFGYSNVELIWASLIKASKADLLALSRRG